MLPVGPRGRGAMVRCAWRVLANGVPFPKSLGRGTSNDRVYATRSRRCDIASLSCRRYESSFSAGVGLVDRGIRWSFLGAIGADRSHGNADGRTIGVLFRLNYSKQKRREERIAQFSKRTR